MLLPPCKLPAFPWVTCALSFHVHARQPHSHVPTITSPLPNDATLHEGVKSQGGQFPVWRTRFQQTVPSPEHGACELCSEGLLGKYQDSLR